MPNATRLIRSGGQIGHPKLRSKVIKTFLEIKPAFPPPPSVQSEVKKCFKFKMQSYQYKKVQQKAENLLIGTFRSFKFGNI